MQAVDDLVERQRTHPSCGEFNCQRHAVETPTYLGHRVDVVCSVKSGRARRARSANNSIASLSSRSDGTCQFTSPATVRGSRLVARSSPWSTTQDAVDDCGARVQ